MLLGSPEPEVFIIEVFYLTKHISTHGTITKTIDLYDF